MKSIVGVSGIGSGGRLLLVVTALLLALPTSFAVLCIAPGSHIAMEKPGEECCASGEHAQAGALFPGGGSPSAVGRPGCTDLYLLTGEPGRIERPGAPAALAAFAAEAALVPPPAAPGGGRRLPAPPDAPGLSCPPSALPLLC
ncbi:MAG: hypothetical protein GXY47_01190 [Acidobacteria bacterium]|nr:hypothetical protein [Acidobacteriota bacterium]